jgi:DinB superfamily
MRYESIADIYSANAKIRERLTETLNGVSNDVATALPDNERWSIQQIVEHVSIVDTGTIRICGKLLDKARNANNSSDGSFTLSPGIDEKFAAISDIKVGAPERVQPTGNVTIAESLRHMAANVEGLNSMGPDLERYDLTEHRFPHPFFGELTAGEWLVVKGGHEMRHTEQIERLREKART